MGTQSFTGPNFAPDKAGGGLGFANDINKIIYTFYTAVNSDKAGKACINRLILLQVSKAVIGGIHL